MSDKVRLEAVISASAQGMVDALKRASAAVNDSTASWKDRLGRARGDLATVSDAVRNLGAELGKVGQLDLQADSGALDKIRESLAGASGAFSTVQAEVEALKASLVGLREQASAMGMPVEEYQRFGEAVKAAGVDAQAAEGMISSMRSRIQDFANGVPEAVELFGRLGVTLDQLGSRSPAQNLAAIAEAIQGTVPATEQADVSIRMYGQSMDNVISTAKEYSRVLENKGSSEYASDRDIQQAISMADAVDKLGAKVGDLAGAMGRASAGAASQASAVERAQLLFNSADEALRRYNERLQESAQATWDVSTAYNDLNRVMTQLSIDTRQYMQGSGVDSQALYDSFSNAEEYLLNFKQRVEEEFAAIQTIMEKRLRAGGRVDTTELDAAMKHVRELLRDIGWYQKSLSKTGFGLGDFSYQLVSLNNIYNQLFDLQERAAHSNFLPEKSVLSADLDKVIEKLDRIRSTDVKVRPKVDMAEIDELRSKMDALRRMSGKFGISAGMYDDVAGKMAQVESMLASINREAAMFSAESARIPGLWERMSGSVGSFGRAIGGVFAHPIRSMQELHGWAMRTMDAVNGIGRAGQNAGSGVSGMARQVAGMLLGVGSMAAGVVKAFRMIGNIIRDNLVEPLRDAWKGMVELSERRLSINQDLYSSQADKWKSAKQALQEYYNLWRKTRSEEATSVDAAKEAKARRDLERDYGITVEASSGDMKGQVAGLMDDAQSSYVKALEGRRKEIEAAMETAQQSLEKVSKYWTSGIWYRGNKSQYESDIKGLQDKLNNLSTEYAKVTEALHRARRETPGADFAEQARATARDEQRRMIDNEIERARKAREEKAKRREEAAGELADWNAEVNLDDVERRIRDVWKKYARIVERGGDREEAYQAALAAVTKIREEAAKRLAEEQEREAEEAGRRAETLENAREREEDARRRLYEATKGLAEAQEREAYRMRLDAIGKARERLRRKMDAFGFTLPDGFRSSRPNLSVRERRTIRLDDRIADKLARRQAGGHVHFTARERERIRALERLQRRDKALTAEEKAMQAAQTQQSAADTMQSAASQFSEAVKGLQKAVEERMKAEGKAGGKAPERSEGGTPSPAPMPRPRRLPRPAAVEEEPAPRKLDRDEYARRYRGDPARLDEYYRKYSESYDRRHGVKRDAGRINAGLANSISRLYAPPRYADTGAGTRDYTSLLERIETAIKNNKGNLTLK